MSHETGQWLELKPVMCQTLTTQRAVKLEALLMARTQCQTECIAYGTATNGSFEATCCTVSSLLWSVARKCCSSQVPLCQVTSRLVSVSRSVPPNTAQTERVLTRLVVTPPLRQAVCAKPKECCKWSRTRNECRHSLHVDTR